VADLTSDFPDEADRGPLDAGRRSHLPSWLMKPFARKLGWRPEFNLFDELQFAGIAITECRKVGQFGMFTALICTP